MDQRVRDILKQLRREFEAFYGNRLVEMVLYGSQARGDAEEGSDIDVLVVLEGPVDPGEEISRTGEIVARLSLENDVVISCVYMDEPYYRNRNGPFLRNVRREGVPA